MLEEDRIQNYLGFEVKRRCRVLMEDMIYYVTVLFLAVANFIRFMYWLVKCRKIDYVCESAACRFSEYCPRRSRIAEKEQMEELHRCIVQLEKEKGMNKAE